MSTEAIIFTGVAIYMVVMLIVGIYAAKKTNSMDEFIIAGRGMPMLLLSTTIIATWFGGGTMMGSAGAAYDDGLLGVIADPLGAAIGLFVIGMFFARLLRRLRIRTVGDFMRQRYGRIAEAAISVFIVVSNIAWVGAMLVAFGLVFESLTGTPMIVGVLSGAVVVIVYTAIGGLWAVAMTDFIQMLIIIVGLLILFVTVLIDVGGWGAIYAQLPENTFRLLPLENTSEHWLNYLRACFIVGLVDISSQSLNQRVLAAKSERAAQNAFYLGSISYLTLGMIPVMLGIIASVTMPGLSDSEAVIPTLAIEHLHPVGVAIFVGAMLAAIMSSADSALLGAASMISNNLFPMLKRDPSPKLSLLVARLSIPACGIVSILVALRYQVVYDLMLDANILGLAAIIVPFILGVWWTKANRTGALASMTAGIAAWLASMYFAPQLPADFIGLGASIVTMLIVTPLTQKSDPPKGLHDPEGNPIEMTNRLGILPIFKRS